MSPLIRLLASFIALMMAMGIGRFALTPQLPHLLSEGQIDLTAAGLIAAANYLGYFVGAVDAMFSRRPEQVRRRLLGGLWLCVLLTLASFWANGFWSHLLLRFGTGVASAWVLVMITALSQPLAAAAGRPRLGALVFAGPGLGIFLTGLLALGSNLLGQTSATLWLVYAGVGLVMLLGILPFLPQPAATATSSPSATTVRQSRHRPFGRDLWVVRFGLHHSGHVPVANGQRAVPWSMAGRSVLAVLRAGGGYRRGAGQSASATPECHASLADGDVMAASRRRVRLPAGQRPGPGAGGDPVWHTVPGLHAAGDATLPGAGAPCHPAQCRDC